MVVIFHMLSEKLNKFCRQLVRGKHVYNLSDELAVVEKLIKLVNIYKVARQNVDF